MINLLINMDLPKKTIVRKNITDKMLENGINVRTAGKTTNARSGPESGISFIGIPDKCDIWPIKLKMTNEARKPHKIVNSGTTTEVYLTS